MPPLSSTSVSVWLEELNVSVDAKSTSSFPFLLEKCKLSWVKSSFFFQESILVFYNV